MYVDEEHCFWLNGNYSVYPEPSEKACMEVARTAEGYFVGYPSAWSGPGRPRVGTRTLSCPSPC